MIKVTGVLRLDDIDIEIHDMKDAKVAWLPASEETELTVKLDNATFFFSVDAAGRLIVLLGNLLATRGKTKPEEEPL